MAQAMPWSLMRLWQAYEQLEPFGEERADLRIAQLCALVANRTRAKGERAFKVQDFMLQTAKDRPVQARKKRDPRTVFRSLKNMFLASAGRKPDSGKGDNG